MTFIKSVNYAKLDHDRFRHHARYLRFVDAMPRKFPCQECHGAGGETEPVLDDGSGPFFCCGVCEGTGYVTPWMRGLWLKWKRQEKAA